MKRLLGFLLAGLVPIAWGGGLLTVPDTTNDRLMLFSADDGSLVNPAFLNLTEPDGGTAMAAVMVGNELWISDQSLDGIWRYTLDGTTYLGLVGAPTGGYSSPAGLEVVGDVVYVADRGNNRVVRVNALTAAPLGTFNVGFDGSGTPYDVLKVNHLGYGDELLINDGSSVGDADNIDVFTLEGVYRRTFHNSDGSTGIDQPQQMSLTLSGTILAAGSVAPYGIFEYDLGGNQVNYWARTASVRGVYSLNNGAVLFTDSGGVHLLEPQTGVVTDVLTGIAARHIEAYVPEPASLGLVLVGALALLRRR